MKQNIDLDIIINGTRQRALWGYWNRWINNVGTDLGLDSNLWYDAANDSTDVRTSKSEKLLERAQDYAQSYGNSEKGAANIEELSIDDKQYGTKVDRKQFSIKKTGDIVKLEITYKNKNGVKKTVTITPDKGKENFKYQQITSIKKENGVTKLNFEKKNVSKIGKGESFDKLGEKWTSETNNFVVCKLEGAEITGIHVYVKKKIEGEGKANIYLLTGNTKKQKLIYVTHKKNEGKTVRDDKSDKVDVKHYTLEVEKYVGTETSKGKVRNDKEVTLKFYLMEKVNGEYLYLTEDGKLVDEEHKNKAKVFSSNDKPIELKRGTKYKIKEIKDDKYETEILKVKAYKNGKLWNDEDDVKWDEYGKSVIFKVPDKKTDIKIKIEITDEPQDGNKYSLLVKKVGEQTEEMAEENTDGAAKKQMMKNFMKKITKILKRSNKMMKQKKMRQLMVKKSQTKT